MSTSGGGPAGPLRVIVADDQTVVREGLVTILDLLGGIEVVAAAADGDEAVALAGEHEPDVVLMDLRMPHCDGVEATRRIREAHPRTEVVVLTTYEDDESIVAALRAGARGYLTKDAGSRQIAQAINAAVSGQAVLSPGVQARLVAAAAGGGQSAAAGGTAAQGSPGAAAGHGPLRALPPLPDGLTAREADVLRLIAAGQSNAEIAAALFVSEATVKTHINHLFAKARLRDRAQAVQYAYRHGLAG
ncbi:MAG TPA: response regulator transcription factor [Streptosporangiaceae bacterium]|nr:response regulator transcription factor [Streptosporangiaceae bacterium]